MPLHQNPVIAELKDTEIHINEKNKQPCIQTSLQGINPQTLIHVPCMEQTPLGSRGQQ